MTNTGDQVVRFGLIGTGRGTKFARIVHRVPGARLACVLDPNEESRAAFAAEFPNIAVVGSLDDLLDGRVDAIYLASPQQYHGPQGSEPSTQVCMC